MKLERLLIIGLSVAVVYLSLTRNETVTYVKSVQAQESQASKKYSMTIPTLFTNELDAVRVNANSVRVLGNDLLKIHEGVINILLKKGIITQDEAENIVESAKIKGEAK